MKWKFLNWMTAVFAEDEKQEEEKVSAWRRKKSGESERSSEVSFKIIFKASFLWKVKPIFIQMLRMPLKKLDSRPIPLHAFAKLIDDVLEAEGIGLSVFPSRIF